MKSIILSMFLVNAVANADNAYIYATSSLHSINEINNIRLTTTSNRYDPVCTL